uniref:Uncharacterized protein n=1 Tax=Sphaerodactylus townsendi TaxID=933632 RepID=A0ACB8EC04_9SAUR
MGGRLRGSIPPTGKLPVELAQTIFIQMFKDGLDPEVLQGALVSGNPDTLMGWICLACLKVVQRAKQCRGLNPHQPTQRSTGAGARKHQGAGETIYACRHCLGLCLHCGEVGRLIAKCPEKHSVKDSMVLMSGTAAWP